MDGKNYPTLEELRDLAAELKALKAQVSTLLMEARLGII